jgi:hypothetical protein
MMVMAGSPAKMSNAIRHLAQEQRRAEEEDGKAADRRWHPPLRRGRHAFRWSHCPTSHALR